MTPILRRTLAGITIVGGLASVVAGRERPTLDLAQPTPASAGVAPAQAGAQFGLDLDKLALRTEHGDEKKGVDPFAPRSFSPIEGPAQAGGPRQPVAPPLPFKYLGKMIEDGKLNVFLAHGEESLSVHAGQKIGEYRVESVTDREIVFTYLPLKTKQSLPL